MEIISIEGRTYETLMQRLEQFTRKVDDLCERNGGREMGKWLTNQDVCLILNISKRTLQTLRDNGKLAYTQINRTIFYKPDDVEKLIGAITEKEVRHE